MGTTEGRLHRRIKRERQNPELGGLARRPPSPVSGFWLRFIAVRGRHYFDTPNRADGP
jgi:hypothetical protein